VPSSPASEAVAAFARDWDPVSTEYGGSVTDRHLVEVYRRRPDEATDDLVRGSRVELVWRGDPLKFSVEHHRDPVPHRHCFDLVMGDIDRRGLESALERCDLRSRLNSKLRIQIAQRLVHQKHLRLPNDGAPHCEHAAVARRTATAACARGTPRGRGCVRPRARARESLVWGHEPCAGRSPCCPRRSYVGIGHRSGRPSPRPVPSGRRSSRSVPRYRSTRRRSPLDPPPSAGLSTFRIPTAPQGREILRPESPS
jgi:hypothetical protein